MCIHYYEYSYDSNDLYIMHYMDVSVTLAYPLWCFYLFTCLFSHLSRPTGRPTLLDAGESVEYFGAKMQRWIPAKVGGKPGPRGLRVEVPSPTTWGGTFFHPGWFRDPGSPELRMVSWNLNVTFAFRWFFFIPCSSSVRIWRKSCPPRERSKGKPYHLFFLGGGDENSKQTWEKTKRTWKIWVYTRKISMAIRFRQKFCTLMVDW